MIHLASGGTPFCGAALEPGDFVSDTCPRHGGCVRCLLMAAHAIHEACARLKRAGNAHYGDLIAETRRVRDEILSVGLDAWTQTHVPMP